MKKILKDSKVDIIRNVFFRFKSSLDFVVVVCYLFKKELLFYNALFNGPFYLKALVKLVLFFINLIFFP